MARNSDWAPSSHTTHRQTRNGTERVARGESHGVVDMEEKFCSVSLDIIGRAVFNFEFHSSTSESPIVKAVYRLLKEARDRRRRRRQSARDRRSRSIDRRSERSSSLLIFKSPHAPPACVLARARRRRWVWARVACPRATLWMPQAEHRTTALLPYWDLPFADRIFDSQVDRILAPQPLGVTVTPHLMMYPTRSSTRR